MRGISFLAGVVGVLLLIPVISIIVAILVPIVARSGAFDGDTLAILCVALVVIVMIVARTIVHLESARSRNASKERDAEETQLIQEMHRSMTRMQERIEALETLWMEKSREDSFLHKL